jgi:hypothetical protein
VQNVQSFQHTVPQSCFSIWRQVWRNSNNTQRSSEICRNGIERLQC